MVSTLFTIFVAHHVFIKRVSDHQKFFRPVLPASQKRTDASKMLEFPGKPPLSGVEKNHDFRVTLWYHFVTTNAKFNGWWNHQTSNISQKV